MTLVHDIGENVSSRSTLQRIAPWAALLIALLLTLFIPSHDSLWLDEAQTASYAAQPTFADVLRKLATDSQSDAQMPLGMMSAWFGGRILGTGEWELRAPNIAWAIVAILGLWMTARRLRLPGLELLFAVHPFLWFYANEARPYTMQLAAASWLLFGVVDCIHRRATGRVWIWALAMGAIVVAGASMLGLVMVASVLVVLTVIIMKESWFIPRSS